MQKGKNSAIDLMYAYAHATLDDETIKLPGFSSDDKLFDRIFGFYGLKRLHQGPELIYADNIFLMSNSKTLMLPLFKQLHAFANQEYLKLALQKSFSMVFIVNYLINEIDIISRM